MQLAEAVQLRADLLKKIQQIEHRIKPNLIVEESKSPQEDPAKMLAQLRKSIQDYKEVVIKINKYNNVIKTEGYDSLMEAIARRDSLNTLLTKLRTIRLSSQIHSNYDNPRATLDIGKLQNEIDQLEIDLRNLNSKIQETNWSTNIEE